MRQAGFVLAGGRSSRMGRDKALLPFRGTTLLEHVSAEVLAAAGSITIIGDPTRYSVFGYPVIADRIPDCGPIGGLYTLLRDTHADWNLVVACDMPELRREDFSRLLNDAFACGGGCLLPITSDGARQPLCGIYHRSCLAAVAAAIAAKRLKMLDITADFHPVYTSAIPAVRMVNVNTPGDWSRYAHGD